MKLSPIGKTFEHIMAEKTLGLILSIVIIQTVGSNPG